MKCPSCNAEISDSVKFCPECGSKIDRKKYCPNCGAEINANMKFCPECGEAIGASTLPQLVQNNDVEDEIEECEELTDEAKEALSDSKYADSFSEDSFWDKVKSVAKKAGSKVIREALLLWYVLQSPDVPWTQKSAIIAALGYFISPIDLVPDFIPVAGYSDDLAALIGVHEMVQASITPQIEAQADAKLKEWFG